MYIHKWANARGVNIPNSTKRGKSMKHWKRTAAAILSAALLCGTFPAVTGETGILGTGITASAYTTHLGDDAFDAKTGTLTLSGPIIQNYNNNGVGMGIGLPVNVSKRDVKHIVVKSDAVFPENSEYLFEELTELEDIYFLKGFSTANVTNMRGMFRGCKKLEALDLSSFVTSRVTDMSMMFDGCESLARLELKSFNTARVTNMDYMFQNCAALPALNVQSFDTSNVTRMYGLFSGCNTLLSLDLSSFNTSKVTGMYCMFGECNSLKQVDVSSFDTSNVTQMSSMFYQCKSLKELNLSSFDTSKVTDMGHMFYMNSSLERIAVSDKWTTGKVTRSVQMFTGCTKLKGGNGTAFSTQHIDAEYARVDRAGKPGYLTEKQFAVLTEFASYPAKETTRACVHVGFNADLPANSKIVEYGIIYYNSGTVITSQYLTLNNVGICGIKKVNAAEADLADNGYGVTAVGFITWKDQYGFQTTQYTGEIGGNAHVASYVVLKRYENKALTSGGNHKVYVGFEAAAPQGFDIVDYGLIYYNSGNVINTSHLKLENVGVCGIQKAKYWAANITDKGYGVTAVGFIKVKDARGFVTTLYTGELGNSYTAMTDAANSVSLTRLANKAVSSGGKNKVYLGFSANARNGYTIEDYGLIYYNSGTVITTPYLTLENVGICGIQKAKYWSANITDNGYGVTAVGFVKVKDSNGYVTTLYTGELGAKFANLPH